ncbi:uncharacterized protein EV422DRAFT_532004 [Fimicolochytrium jonesii]|uniref:uncharacterized protein n=1 Tax=Fimicolochytrium jonesii TaxID=1396493 RepID=UPI0022FF0205|nr:uncharacterized protein EV422DRAFT_532004 [Fimicolochytrium jonesii]KAI8820203.1 hypothetical protein EV422DRAFT_532004 [Fimicolochytrium jonesii]
MASETAIPERPVPLLGVVPEGTLLEARRWIGLAIVMCFQHTELEEYLGQSFSNILRICHCAPLHTGLPPKQTLLGSDDIAAAFGLKKRLLKRFIEPYQLPEGHPDRPTKDFTCLIKDLKGLSTAKGSHFIRRLLTHEPARPQKIERIDPFYIKNALNFKKGVLKDYDTSVFGELAPPPPAPLVTAPSVPKITLKLGSRASISALPDDHHAPRHVTIKEPEPKEKISPTKRRHEDDDDVKSPPKRRKSSKEMPPAKGVPSGYRRRSIEEARAVAAAKYKSSQQERKTREEEGERLEPPRKRKADEGENHELSKKRRVDDSHHQESAKKRKKPAPPPSRRRSVLDASDIDIIN